MNMSKSGKSAYIRHIFSNNFFFVNFFKTFSTDLKSAWNSAFLIPFWIKKKKIFDHINTFCNFEAKRAKNGSKKENLFFINMS